MTSDVILCPARPADIAAMQHIERRAAALFRSVAGYEFVANGPIRDEAEHRRVQATGRTNLALAEAGGAVGFAMVEPVDGEAHLLEIDVDPDFQRRGVAKLLIAAAEDWAHATGFLAMTLTTYRDIAWNAPFYARLGFVPFDPDTDRRDLARIIAEEKASGYAFAPRVVMRKMLGPRTS